MSESLRYDMVRLKNLLNLGAFPAVHATLLGLSLIMTTYSWSGQRSGGKPKHYNTGYYSYI